LPVGGVFAANGYNPHGARRDVPRRDGRRSVERDHEKGNREQDVENPLDLKKDEKLELEQVPPLDSERGVASVFLGVEEAVFEKIHGQAERPTGAQHGEEDPAGPVSVSGEREKNPEQPETERPPDINDIRLFLPIMNDKQDDHHRSDDEPSHEGELDWAQLRHCDPVLDEVKSAVVRIFSEVWPLSKEYIKPARLIKQFPRGPGRSV
jgi:hypothetical protein